MKFFTNLVLYTLLLLPPVLAYSSSISSWRYNEAVTCNTISTGQFADLCHQTSDNSLWKCMPTIGIGGTCNTSSQWVQVGGTNPTWGTISGTLSNQSDLVTALAGKEASLGNPGTNGYILSSTTAGTRSWIAPPSSLAWGAITGTLSSQTDLQTALNAKQNTITTGATSKYFRGDLSLATFPTNVSSFSNDAGYLTSYTETDPIFVASAAHSISSGDITNLSHLSGTNTGDQDLSPYALTSNVHNVPTAGTSGQVLTKNSNSNYDYSWTAPSGGQTPWTSNINGGGYSLTNAGGLTTYDNVNTQNSVVIGNHSWTEDSYLGHPITIGQYRYTGDVNAPYGIQNNWLYGQQDGDPYFFYADAPGLGTLYFGDLYNNYGGAEIKLAAGNIATTSPAGFNMNISGSSFQINTSADYNSFYIDGTTGAINSTNTAIDNDGQGTFIVNNGYNPLTQAFTVYDSQGNVALQVNNSDGFGQGDYVETLNNVLDDGSGNMSLAGGAVTIGPSNFNQIGFPTANGNIYFGTFGYGPSSATAGFSIPNYVVFAFSALAPRVGFGGQFQWLGNEPQALQDLWPTENIPAINISSVGVITSGNVIQIGNTSYAGTVYKVDYAGNETANSFIKSGGTSSQFLKADGTLDSSTYLPYKTKGTITLVSGTKALTISGVTTSNQAFVQLVTPGGTLGGAYKAVCTSNTLTVTSIGATGTTITTDTSTLNYLIV